LVLNTNKIFARRNGKMACCGKKDAKATKPADKADSKKKSK
jgi:hypothetical protein